MKQINKPLLAAAMSAVLMTPAAFAESTTYNIDPDHTSVIATWSHFGFSNPTATFDDASGTITFDDEDTSASSINVTIPVDTVDTYVKKLTNEFMNKEYFNVDEYPEATFKSNRVEETGSDEYKVHGDLTIKGTTKPVTFDVTLNKQGEHPMTKKQAIGFDATTTIMRSDFGLDKYVPNVSDEVMLRITTEAQAK
ncbi:polyisoprenoid-binding protein [Salinimonas sp. HHU 13199]|uniref:Polyisoprenoid-binding protein n=1 Tax=Salinimonas profundi TaxID=2729140 RepID=A0ABR8LI96_9ALTE|nr:YceI family protein [Salinimonas profundi]MBD3585948.1 polyisoprenoid-binding protein [Salinimonas profundi]